MLHSVILASIVFYNIISMNISHREGNNWPVSKYWKWKNSTTSLIHSIITSILTTICVIQDSNLIVELIETKTWLSSVVIASSTGYFMYDFYDIIMKEGIYRHWYILVHHFMVIVGFSFCNFFGTHHGFGISALLLEWNTIFLHTRTILHLNECENKLINRINLMLTILSWIIFRFLLAFYIVYYHFNNYTRMSMLSNIVGIFGVFVMLIINIGQAKVIYSKDIKGKRKSN